MEKSSAQFMHHKEQYTKNLCAQASAIKELLPTLKRVLGDVDTSDDNVFTVCDYGAADGGNSLPVIKVCRDHLDASHGRGFPLCWVFNDLPRNNFGALFQHVQECCDNTQTDTSNIISLASGKSFYKQVMPRGSVHLGVCFNAVHWLSERPDKEAFAMTERLRTVTKEIGQRNWKQFLLSRAEELKPGGQLLVTVSSEDINKKRFVNKHAKLLALQHLLTEGMISEDEFKLVSFDFCVNRSEEEIRFPFEREPHLPVIKEGLQLISIVHHRPEDKLVIEWENSGGAKDESATKDFVRKMVNMVKTTSNIYLSVLAISRDTDEYGRLVEKFYSAVEEVIHQNPHDFESVCGDYAVQIKKI